MAIAGYFDAMERVILTLWVGAMWAVGYLAVPLVFHGLEDRRVAGELAAPMFSTVSYVGLVACLLLFTLAVLRERAGGRMSWRRLRFGLLAVAAALIGIGLFVLQPQMASLKSAGIASGTENAAQFGRLHGISSLLYLVTSLAGMGLVWIAGDRRPST